MGHRSKLIKNKIYKNKNKKYKKIKKKVLMKKGNHVNPSIGNKSEWNIVSDKKPINFPNTSSPTKVCDCKIVLEQNEVVTVIISNIGNQISGGLKFFFLVIFILF